MHRLHEAVLQINIRTLTRTQCIFSRRLPPVDVDKVLTQIQRPSINTHSTFNFQNISNNSLLTNVPSAPPRYAQTISPNSHSSRPHPPTSKRCTSRAHPCPIHPSPGLLPHIPLGLSSPSKPFSVGRAGICPFGQTVGFQEVINGQIIM
jgi:hypothetical protein